MCHPAGTSDDYPEENQMITYYVLTPILCCFKFCLPFMNTFYESAYYAHRNKID